MSAFINSARDCLEKCENPPESVKRWRVKQGGGGAGQHEVRSFIMEVIRVVFLSFLFLFYSRSLAFTPPLPHSPPKPHTETEHRGVLLQVYSLTSARRQTRRCGAKQQGCCSGLKESLLHINFHTKTLKSKVGFCFLRSCFCQTFLLLSLQCCLLLLKSGR